MVHRSKCHSCATTMVLTIERGSNPSLGITTVVPRRFEQQPHDQAGDPPPHTATGGPRLTSCPKHTRLWGDWGASCLTWSGWDESVDTRSKSCSVHTARMLSLEHHRHHHIIAACHVPAIALAELELQALVPSISPSLAPKLEIWSKQNAPREHNMLLYWRTAMI